VLALARDQNARDLYLSTHRVDDRDPLGLADLPDLAGLPLWITASANGTLSVASAALWRCDGSAASRGGTTFHGADLARSERLYPPMMRIRMRDVGAMQSLAVLDGPDAEALVVLSDPEDLDPEIDRLHRRASEIGPSIEAPRAKAHATLRPREPRTARPDESSPHIVGDK
jgi:hypothetical protein